MTSNQPSRRTRASSGGDVPSATAILDRFLHHASIEIVRITGLKLSPPATAQPIGRADR